MLTLLIFLLVLSLLVFVHEFGHFIVAKRAGLRVDEFGFGFPPRIFGVQRVNGRSRIVWGNPKDFDGRAGGTLYSINALPVGGFVRIKGESGEERDERDSFSSRGAGLRVAIVAAGVIMNVLLAVALIAGGYTVGFPQSVPDNISKYAHVEDSHVEIVGVLPESPADSAGIKPGDRVLKAAVGEGGIPQTFARADEFRAFVTEFVEKPLVVVVVRQGTEQTIEVTPKILEQTGRAGIGVALSDTATIRYPLWLAVPKAFELTGVLIKTIVVTVADLIRDAFAGRPVAADLTGPVGIAVLTGQAARMGWVFLIQFVALLSINLAILNILPIPALDGGRILFILIEKVLRRPMSRKIEARLHQVGFALLILLVLFVTYRDFGRYGGAMAEFFRNLAH